MLIYTSTPPYAFVACKGRPLRAEVIESFLHRVQTHSGALPSSYAKRKAGSFPWGEKDQSSKLNSHLDLALRKKFVELYVNSVLQTANVLFYTYQ